jgi:hypothetical protein
MCARWVRGVIGFFLMKQISDSFTDDQNGSVNQSRNILIFLNISLFMCILWFFVFLNILSNDTGTDVKTNLIPIAMFCQVVIMVSLFLLAQGRLLGYQGLFIGFSVNIVVGISFDLLLLLNGILGLWALRHFIGSKKILLT